jgi:hypothetical protein
MNHQTDRILGRILAISETDAGIAMPQDQASAGIEAKGRSLPFRDSFPILDGNEP